MQLHHLQAALDLARGGQLEPFHDLSKKHGGIDPDVGTPWALKAVAGLVQEMTGPALDIGQPEARRLMESRQMQSLLARHLPQVIVLAFRVPKKRRIGLGAGDRSLPLPDWTAALIEPPEALPPAQVLPPDVMGGAPRYRAQVQRLVRDGAVVADARQRAQGDGVHWHSPAPCVMAAGVPFLKVHHILPLAQNGPDRLSDVMALGPDSQRKAHHGARGLA